MTPIAVRDKDARDSLVPTVGMEVHRLDTGEREVFVGGVTDPWVPSPFVRREVSP